MTSPWVRPTGPADVLVMIVGRPDGHHVPSPSRIRGSPIPAVVRARLIRLTERDRQLQEQVQRAVDRLHQDWCARLGEVLSGWQALVVVLVVVAGAGAVAGSTRRPD